MTGEAFSTILGGAGLLYSSRDTQRWKTHSLLLGRYVHRSWFYKRVGGNDNTIQYNTTSSNLSLSLSHHGINQLLLPFSTLYPLGVGVAVCCGTVVEVDEDEDIRGADISLTSVSGSKKGGESWDFYLFLCCWCWNIALKVRSISVLLRWLRLFWLWNWDWARVFLL